MKFKKLDITFKSKKIQSKDILAVYEYGDYLIAKFQFYTSKLSYNFGQNQYCKDVIDNLIKSGKKFEELEGKEFYQIVQSKF